MWYSLFRRQNCPNAENECRLNNTGFWHMQGSAFKWCHTDVRVLLLGRALDEPDFVLGMMRLLATSTTSLPLNFFSSSRTSLCWIFWKPLSNRYGTWMMMAFFEGVTSISCALEMYRSRKSVLKSWLVASKSKRAWTRELGFSMSIPEHILEHVAPGSYVLAERQYEPMTATCHPSACCCS